MRRCGEGITRYVLIFDKFVVKFPRFWWNWFWFLTGLISNLRERGWWKMVRDSEELSPWFCPILFADPFGLIVVMPRCEPITTPELPDYDQLPYKADYKVCNFGRYKGRVVLLDYAS